MSVVCRKEQAEYKREQGPRAADRKVLVRAAVVCKRERERVVDKQAQVLQVQAECKRERELRAAYKQVRQAVPVED